MCKIFSLIPQKNGKIYGTIQKTETPKFYKLKTTKLHKMHNTFKLRIKGTKTTMVYKLRDGARSENLSGQVVMLPGGAFYSAKIWVGLRPPCPPASATPDLLHPIPYQNAFNKFCLLKFCF